MVTCVAPLFAGSFILALKCSTGWLWRMDDKRSAVLEMAVELELVFMLIPNQIRTGQSDYRYQLYQDWCHHDEGPEFNSARSARENWYSMSGRALKNKSLIMNVILLLEFLKDRRSWVM